MLYRTLFELEYPVTDMDRANAYLKEDDMRVYLVNDSDEAAALKDKVTKIEWTLDDLQSGHIDLETTTALSSDELTLISDWVSGQNSDGLGEGFEQQPFASYYCDPYTGEPIESFYYLDEDEEPDHVMASFDWETNNYEFTLN